MLQVAVMVDRGYVGSVGTGPGITVIVSDVGSEDEAFVVCDDVVAALRDDAGYEQLSVEVMTSAGTTLATGGTGQACVPTGGSTVEPASEA